MARGGKLAFLAGRLAAVALAALVAGCASAPVAAPEPAALAAPAPPGALDWSMADCESVTWSVPVLASSLQPHLPDGFTPAGGGAGGGVEAGAPAAAGQAATLGFRAVECAAGFGQGEILRSVQSGALFTPVLPPAELRDDRFGARYAFAWGVLVAHEPWRAAADGWGLPVHDGGAFAGPTAQGWTGALAMDQVGSFTVSGRTVEAEHAVPAFEARTITPGARGFALWDATVADVRVATGVGAWTVDPESWVAAVLGTTQGVATFELATWSQPFATVHWPGEALDPIEGDGGRLLPDLPA